MATKKMIEVLRKEAVDEGCKTKKEIEDYVIDIIVMMANSRKVKRVYGKERWEYANDGWFIDGSGKDIRYLTKVYGMSSGKPTMIVTSYWDGKKVAHEHDEYQSFGG